MNSRTRLLALVAIVGLIAGAGVLFLRVGPPRGVPPAGGAVVSLPRPTPQVVERKTVAPAAPDPAGAFAAGFSDDASALDAARRIDDRFMRAEVFGELFRRWLKRDFAAAFAYAGKLPPGTEATTALLMALHDARQRDPLHALALARSVAVTPDVAIIYSAIFADLVARDRPSALAALAETPAGLPRENALRAVLDEWGRDDLAAALAWAQALPDPTDRSIALDTTLALLARQDPQRAVQVALQSLTGPALERVLTPAFEQLLRTDLVSACALVAQIPAGEVQVHTALEVARVLAARNPAEAIAWIDTLPSGDTHRIALNNALEVWAATDAAGATHYVAQLPAGSVQDAAAADLARVLGERAPTDAVAFAASLGSDSAKSAAMIALASGWARTDPVSAAQWVAAQPPSQAELDALAGALSYWALQDISAARNFVGTLTGRLQTRGATELAPTLVQQDPAVAVMWAQSLSNPVARDAALTTIATRWTDTAPEAASAWALGLAPGTSRDNLLAAIAQRYAAQNPTRAQELISAIGSPELRQAAQSSLPGTAPRG